MINLSQQDPRWANVTLGNSRYTIGRYGCTTTCLSMLSDYFKCYQAPDKVAKGGAKYTLDGYIIWESLNFSSMAFEARVRSRDDKMIQTSLNDRTRAVILNVNNGAHWVVAVNKVLFSNDYWVIDPWSGNKVKACKTYKNIVGSAHLKWK